jgi:hypothetical protein
MIPPSDHPATPAGFRRNAWLASIGTGGWFASESMAGFVGIRSRGISIAIMGGLFVSSFIILPLAWFLYYLSYVILSDLLCG